MKTNSTAISRGRRPGIHLWLACLGVALLTLAAPVRPAEPAAKPAENSRPDSTGRRPAVRVIVLKGTYADYAASSDINPMSLFLGELEKPGSFFDLCEKIDKLAKEDRIQHVLFDLSSPTLRLNLAQLSELPRHIQKLRDAGKRTFAWIENADTVHYVVASACDKILIAELGSLDLPSLSLMTLHFRDAMDLLGARASFVRTGDYKGAVEPFTSSEMSEPLRTHYRQLLGSINDALVEQISAGRKLGREEFRKIQSDRWFTPLAAQQAKLVDAIVSSGATRASVAKLIGQEVSWIEPGKAKPKQLSFFDLIGKIMSGGQEPRATKPAIALVHLDGQIVDGENERPGVLASGPAVKAINELAADDQVRAVVARINSPGGSASASESIRAALEQLAKKKPLIVSMGDMAASGGYWISCVGRAVYAEPETLTGSIGVFALKLSFGPLLKKIGLNVQSVTLDESAGAMALDRVWTPVEQERMQTFVDEIYGKFLKLVAHSRKLSSEQVSRIAGGRVWSGAQALKLGLVDKIGGLDQALAAAAKEASLDSGYEVIHRPQKKNLFELLDLFDQSTDEIKSVLSPAAKRWLGEAGFDCSVPLNLVRESLSGRSAKVWLLGPGEMVIR